MAALPIVSKLERPGGKKKPVVSEVLPACSEEEESGPGFGGPPTHAVGGEEQGGRLAAPPRCRAGMRPADPDKATYPGSAKLAASRLGVQHGPGEVASQPPKRKLRVSSRHRPNWESFIGTPSALPRDAPLVALATHPSDYPPRLTPEVSDRGCLEQV